jgi:hypothetical protein
MVLGRIFPGQVHPPQNNAMKTKLDWIALGAALSIACLMYLMMISDAWIFPAFAGSVALLLLVSRSAQRPAIETPTAVPVKSSHPSVWSMRQQQRA